MATSLVKAPRLQIESGELAMSFHASNRVRSHFKDFLPREAGSAMLAAVHGAACHFLEGAESSFRLNLGRPDIKRLLDKYEGSLKSALPAGLLGGANEHRPGSLKTHVPPDGDVQCRLAVAEAPRRPVPSQSAICVSETRELLRRCLEVAQVQETGPGWVPFQPAIHHQRDDQLRRVPRRRKVGREGKTARRAGPPFQASLWRTLATRVFSRLFDASPQ
jgi:hypothetical protein